jgi:predicted O-methyltransferase YrrM
LNEVIDRIFRSNRVEDAQGNAYAPTSSVTFETGALLYDFVRKVRPERTLEIGMAYGISTLFICQALRDNDRGSHTAIDPLEEAEFRSVGLLNLDRAKLKHLVRLHEAPSHLVLPQFCMQNERFDFAFIDGRHVFDFVVVDFFYIDRLLPVNGHVAFDDLWMPAIRKAVSFVLRNKPYRLVRMPSRYPPPLWRQALRVARRFGQSPGARDWALKCVPSNVVFLEKVALDDRPWHFHRPF